MSSIHLSSDDRSTMQSHLSELGKRLTWITILAVILTIIWSFSIDIVLNKILTKLDPCDGTCVNIFSPDEWAATRWFAAAIMGLLTTAPFAISQAYSFSAPGLLPSERKGFLFWMFGVWILSFIALWLTVMHIIPNLFAWGHTFAEGTRLQGRYDAAEMLRLCLSVAWSIVLVLAASMVVSIAGRSRLLWAGNSGWWRFRIHGMMVMLLWVSIPSALPGVMISLTVISISIVELVGFFYFRAQAPSGHGLLDIYDRDGGIHRVLYADCSCCGTTLSIAPLKGMGVAKFNSVCRSSKEQDKLLDLSKRYNVTDIVFSGCFINSLPPNFVESLAFLGITIKSLNIAHLTTMRTDMNDVDLHLAMASLIEPWSIASSCEKITEIVERNAIKSVYYSDEIPFGFQLVSGEGWITGLEDSQVQLLSNSGINLIPYSN